MLDNNYPALVLLKSGRINAALRELAAIPPAERNDHWRLLHARCHLKLGNLDYSYQLLYQIPGWQYQYPMLIFYAKWYEANGNYSDAASVYLAALSIERRPPTFFMLSACCDRLNQTTQEALSIYCQVERWQRNPLIVRKISECFNKLGRYREVRVINAVLDEDREFLLQSPLRILTLLMLNQQYGLSLTQPFRNLLYFYQLGNPEQYRAQINDWMRGFLHKLEMQKDQVTKEKFVRSLKEFGLFRKLFGFAPAAKLETAIDQLELAVQLDFGRNAAHAHHWKLAGKVQGKVGRTGFQRYTPALFPREAPDILRDHEGLNAEKRVIQALDLAVRPIHRK